MWWLMSSETAEQVRQALAACGGEKADEAYMLIDTGLHLTDAVPNDYKTDTSSRQRVRELITCLMQHCDLKIHGEKNTKIITEFTKDFYGHLSFCAMNNMPAYPNGECDCGVEAKK